MKLTVFQSDKGDCMLMTTAGGKGRMLVDGSMPGSYERHVAPYLEKTLTKNARPLDVVYVSHIDDDHIAGVLKMMDDLVEWRVFDHQKKTGNPAAKQPVVARPPDVKALWYNAFSAQVGKKTGPITGDLDTSSLALAGRDLAAAFRRLEESKEQAVRLTRRASPEQLGIKINPEYGGELMQVKVRQPRLTIGGAHAYLIGPFAKDLEKLRKQWNAWLDSSKKTLEKIARDAIRDQDRLTSDADRILEPLRAQRELLERTMGQGVATVAGLGDRSMVTPPNLASLMLLLEEDGQTVLFSGDGHCDDIVSGLEHHRRLREGKPCRVNILKVQHHASEYNINEAFCGRVWADDYLFCGNGENANPDLRVVRLLAESRLRNFKGRFKFWFNSHSTVCPDKNAAHMKKVQDLAKSLAAKSGGRMQVQFLKESYFEVG